MGAIMTGTVSLALDWEEQPGEPVWIWVQVEYRESPTTAGTIHSSAPPAEYAPGEPLAFEMPQRCQAGRRPCV